MHFGAAFVSVADDFDRGSENAINRFKFTVLRNTTANSMVCTLPSRRIVSFSNLDKPFTQETPTPCKPPDTL
jgi:hypothetical protein